MNLRAIWAVYSFEMARTGRTLVQSIVAPVITTSLYFVVFGAAMTRVDSFERTAASLRFRMLVARSAVPLADRCPVAISAFRSSVCATPSFTAI